MATCPTCKSNSVATLAVFMSSAAYPARCRSCGSPAQIPKTIVSETVNLLLPVALIAVGIGALFLGPWLALGFFALACVAYRAVYVSAVELEAVPEGDAGLYRKVTFWLFVGVALCVAASLVVRVVVGAALGPN